MKRCFLYIGIICILWGCGGLGHPDKSAKVLSENWGEEVNGHEQNANK